MTKRVLTMARTPMRRRLFVCMSFFLGVVFCTAAHADDECKDGLVKNVNILEKSRRAQFAWLKQIDQSTYHAESNKIEAIVPGYFDGTWDQHKKQTSDF